MSQGAYMWNVINSYVKNTHGDTNGHTHYTLDLEEVFEVDRKGESKRFRPHSANHNRMLLWHGSRMTNFVGILSQGLRIAPPEAPVTGYMFGKGVYFADMSSKSANYCRVDASSGGTSALLLLCEVALGDMNTKLRHDYNANELPEGKHSVKGLGCNFPNPDGTLTLENGMKVPCGKKLSHEQAENAELLYNEYIVYDEAQVKIRYLVKCKFNFVDI